jgi:hypothetical protein
MPGGNNFFLNLIVILIVFVLLLSPFHLVQDSIQRNDEQHDEE